MNNPHGIMRGGVEIMTKQVMVELSQSMTCGGRGCTIAVSSPYACETCGRMLCKSCSYRWGACGNHRHIIYRDEFERLLDVAEQALTGIDFDNRKVLGFAPLGVLKTAVEHYRAILADETKEDTES